MVLTHLRCIRGPRLRSGGMVGRRSSEASGEQMTRVGNKARSVERDPRVPPLTHSSLPILRRTCSRIAAATSDVSVLRYCSQPNRSRTEFQYTAKRRRSVG